MKELKHCPFCCGKAEFCEIEKFKTDSDIGIVFKIKCHVCGASIRKAYTVSYTMASNGELSTVVDQRNIAISDWNQRAGE